MTRDGGCTSFLSVIAMHPAIARLSAIGGHVVRHRRQKSELERVASSQSRLGLDWMNFFIADVQEGFGAFVAFYLADLKWSQETVGIMLTVDKAASALSLIPGGALADAVRQKRTLVAVAIILIAAAALMLALHPSFLFVIFAEILHGITAGLMTPAGCSFERIRIDRGYEAYPTNV